MKKLLISLLALVLLAGAVGLSVYALAPTWLASLLATGVVGLFALYLLVDYGLGYMASAKTARMPLPGDDLLAEQEKVLAFTKEIVIDAPPSQVWPYLKQQGQNRGGFYSFVLLERIFTFDIRNTYTIEPKWQTLEPGDWIPYHQMGIGSEVMAVVDQQYFTMRSDTRRPPTGKKVKAFALNIFPGGQFAWTWNFILQPLPDHKTHLIQRCHNYFTPTNLLTKGLILLFLGVPSLFMTTRQMEVLKACAEGRVSAEGTIRK